MTDRNRNDRPGLDDLALSRAQRKALRDDEDPGTTDNGSHVPKNVHASDIADRLGTAEWAGDDEQVELPEPDQYSFGAAGGTYDPPQASNLTYEVKLSNAVLEDASRHAGDGDMSVWDDTDIVHVVRESMLGDTATHEVGHVVGDGPDDSGDVQPAEGFSLNFTKIETVVAESGYQALPELDANANRTAGPTSAGVGAGAGASSQVYLGDIVISAISDDPQAIKSPRDVASGQVAEAHDRYANQEVSYVQSDDGGEALLPFVEQDPLVMDHDFGGASDLDGGLDL